MPSSSSRPRRGQVLLWSSLTLFAVFAVFAVCIWQATRTRFDADAKLLEAMADAEFLEDAPLSDDAGWPQWRGVRRDGVAAASDLFTDWPAGGLPSLWKEDLSGWEGYSTFAVHGDRAYTMGRKGDEEAVLCLNANTGAIIWDQRYDPRFETPKGKSFDPTTERKSLPYGNGPRATPTLDGERLYTVGVTGRFQCRTAKDGSLLWEHDLLKEYVAANLQWGVAFSPLVDGDLIFTQPGGPNGKALVAFDKTSGKEVWTSQDDPASYSSPIAITVDGDRQIVFMTNHRLLGVAAHDGSLRWSFPWETTPPVHATTPLAFRVKTAGKERQLLFISSGYGKGCALVALLSDDKGGHKAVAVFESNELRSHYGTPVRVGDHVFGFDEDQLVCLSLRTGRRQWKDRAYHKGNLIAVGEYLLILGENGRLALKLASPVDTPPSAVESHAMTHHCWTAPVLANGRLLLRDVETIRCLDLRKK